MTLPPRRSRIHVRPVIAVAVAAGLGLLGFALVQAVAAESPSPDVTVSASASPSLSFPLVASPIEGSPGASAGAGLEASSPASETPSSSSAPISASPGTTAADLQGNTCYACHTKVDPKQQVIAEQWKASVHGQNGVGCADCHGGDPTSDEVTTAMSKSAGFVGVPGRTATVDLCGTCHANVDKMRQYQIPTDQLAKYKSSVHGQRLLNAQDSRVAICIDCHGVHNIKKASDPTAAVYPLNVPKLCASCHADAKVMEPYGIPTNQFALYQASVHGQALLVNQDLRAPTCASCHGSHDAKPPNSTEVVQVCGKCHTATQALYEQSKHSRLDVGPKCWTCHGNHDVAQPDESRFFHPQPTQLECSTCHNPVDQSLTLRADRFARDQDRRCDTCHHEGSLIYSQAQAIYTSLDRANQAYEQAVARIGEAASAGMIVTDADVQLTQARTKLIQARAAVHTTKLTAVAGLADEAVANATQARDFAQARLQESVFRREAMVVVLGIIVVNVLILIALKRRIDRERATG